MPIKDHEDPFSRVKYLDDKWYTIKQEVNEDFNRFLYKTYDERDGLFIWKKDIDKLDDLWDKEFIIQGRFVNRPDLISHKFYDNAKYWWILALRNDIKDPFKDFYLGRKILIPDFYRFKNQINVKIY